ncbi:hypothetical protein CONCODRAFT_7755 [Conidiobolus coronatus NRRL 28638]|uniref:Extracellular membrane protein CFEM domain-containing protein n=1 Tax=Conidiobolus coronatus (strain ATCC 28846 / CBS 209.66 / NRRL 28638) TaxID=796925 RepID=A0A137P402_CONC2|nr:hypothetical protein CONCODRAFT_7755 [Conidiobolus coronatus NRRL 28638]|eukprot:KXN69745.1 hypothetical protein CONCODRAFT_7755 [Conidiobolus coronatus NRRL 28638]
MKLIVLLSLLATPIISQSCFNSESVINCAINAENTLRNNCANNLQCACSESQRLVACYRSCEGDPNFLGQIASANAQASQYCNGGSFVRSPVGALPSAIPGVWGGPSIQSVNVNSAMIDATATFRTGSWNSRSFRNSGMKLNPLKTLPVVLIISSIALL